MNAPLAMAAWRMRLIDRSEVPGGWLPGAVIWSLGGWRAWILLALFLLTGMLLNLVARRRGRTAAGAGGAPRSARHAWANGAAAAALAL